ncbi:glycosyltransferase family 61 protein [Bradyrhizobium symbiodeficiens]|uniref:Glycosyltransferase family 61 protein n=1 Tax=Bradyrhizobium symbiodeficiens TaxID=1404367 RepID=A0A6G8ZZE4_9BRAD|nr:glycosyltransferase family 61 protein [Bradyrhizobium symbiodeficiens]QIP05528.1 glycosyltransferase family 61 protein [Bradyrhizobium symbiodeficiens]
MSLDIPFGSEPLTYLKRRLKNIPVAVRLVRLCRAVLRRTPCFVMRFIGTILYPILGDRGPLRGYHGNTSDYLRTGLGQYVALTQHSDTMVPPDRFVPSFFVAVIPGARVLAENGAVISPDHRLLADVSWAGDQAASQPWAHPALRKFELPPIQHVGGRVAVINSIQAANYYHWMFDVLPRLGLLQRSGLTADRFIVSATTGFQKDTLKLLGLSDDRLFSPDASTHVRADELVIPSLSGPVFSVSPQQHACEYVRSAFLEKGRYRKPHRAIYITRGDATNRRVVNEPEICDDVAALGFEVVSLSGVPFSKQVEMFAEAKIIVGPHGAGFTNAVFCEPGTVLIEFMPTGRVIDCFERLARIGGLTYHCLVCPEIDTGGGPVTNDHVVDRSALRDLIARYVPGSG